MEYGQNFNKLQPNCCSSRILCTDILLIELFSLLQHNNCIANPLAVSMFNGHGQTHMYSCHVSWSIKMWALPIARSIMYAEHVSLLAVKQNE